jgi:hypothetical protein
MLNGRQNCISNFIASSSQFAALHFSRNARPHSAKVAHFFTLRFLRTTFGFLAGDFAVADACFWASVRAY